MPRIPDLQDHLDDFIWAESLDLAFDSPSHTLWCDDARVRLLAEAIGVETFGTDALLEALRRDGRLDSDVVAHLSSLLVTHGLVGGDFDLELAVSAANLDRWKPGGTALYLAWGPPTERPESRLQFAADAIKKNHDDPVAMSGWAEAASLWLVRAGGYENADSNLVVFLRVILTQTWLRAEALPFIIQGMRAVTRTRGLADPLEAALREHYKTLVGIVEHRTVFDAMRGLVVYMNADDRAVVTRIAFSDQVS